MPSHIPVREFSVYTGFTKPIARGADRQLVALRERACGAAAEVSPDLGAAAGAAGRSKPVLSRPTVAAQRRRLFARHGGRSPRRFPRSPTWPRSRHSCGARGGDGAEARRWSSAAAARNCRRSARRRTRSAAGGREVGGARRRRRSRTRRSCASSSCARRSRSARRAPRRRVGAAGGRRAAGGGGEKRARRRAPRGARAGAGGEAGAEVEKYAVMQQRLASAAERHEAGKSEARQRNQYGGGAAAMELDAQVAAGASSSKGPPRARAQPSGLSTPRRPSPSRRLSRASSSGPRRRRPRRAAADEIARHPRDMRRRAPSMVSAARSRRSARAASARRFAAGVTYLKAVGEPPAGATRRSRRSQRCRTSIACTRRCASASSARST